jgi:3-oxoadipate enol-lactonase
MHNRGPLRDLSHKKRGWPVDAKRQCAAERWFLACVIVVGSLTPHDVAAQGRYAEINGTRIYYEDEGSGHPLVLIHGWPLSERMWDDQARVLKEYYRVIRYDRRGFGQSPGTPWNESSSEHDPADLEALLHYLKVPSAYLVGHSAGGSVVTQFALDHPEQVDALILSSSALGGFVLPETGPFSTLDSLRPFIQSVGMPAFRRAWLALPMNHIPDDKPEVEARLAAIGAQYTAIDVLQPTPAPASKRVAAIWRVHTIKAPTLVIVGANDEPFFQISADALAFEIPGAHKVVVRGGAHMVNMIEPELYTAEVLRFLKNVERSRAARTN